MKRKNTSRNALITSIISMLVCVSMLVGTTFAWFTDEVTTGMNTIAAGNLDVELLADGVAVKSDTKLFDDVALWEPGVVVYENLQVSNVGTLALQYQMALNFGSENATEAGNKLSEVLKVAVIDKIETGAERAQVLAAAKASTQVGALADFSMTGELEAGASSEEKAVVIFWAPNAPEIDNLYNVNNGQKTDDDQPLHIAFGVQLFANQNTVEHDSFDDQYDKPAVVPDGAVVVRNEAELIAAVSGDLPIYIADAFGLSAPIVIPAGKSVQISGNGATLSRVAGYTGTVFSVQTGAALELAYVTVDGGAVWENGTSGEKINNGVTATGNLIVTAGTGSVVLEEGAVLQNNDGAGAVFLATRGGGSLTVNGASILNNRAAGGAAIWGGGNITINAGSKINGNHATSIGGAIRMVDGYNNITFTMNGGEMNNNTSDGTGGAIWGGNRATYNFNGGEMAYNSATSGGAIWTGTYETYKISGDFSLHDNSATELGGAIRFCDHASVTITGGEIYNNTVNGSSSAFYLNNNSASITGGEISDNFSYSGGLGLTVGEADIEGVIHFNLGTNHKTAYLAETFNSFSFTVEDSHVGNFNFKPAAGYTYTDGDEAKLVCLNEGYETYWDAATSTFCLQAK